MQMIQYVYEYAGFKYEIKCDGVRYWTFALPGQHRAAEKEKHRRNALLMWLEENKNVHKVPQDHAFAMVAEPTKR